MRSTLLLALFLLAPLPAWAGCEEDDRRIQQKYAGEMQRVRGSACDSTLLLIKLLEESRAVVARCVEGSKRGAALAEIRARIEQAKTSASEQGCR